MAALRDIFRVPDAAQRRRTQNRENNPMQSRMGPGSAVRHFAPHCVRGNA